MSAAAAFSAASASNSQSQTQGAESWIMTQNELTQMANEDSFFSPPSQALVKQDPRLVSWGRLVGDAGSSNTDGGTSGTRSWGGSGGPIELLPRDAVDAIHAVDAVDSSTTTTASTSTTSTVLNCLQVRPSDKFNQYKLGRNSKMDIVPPKPSSKSTSSQKKIHEWAHSMVSNQHCSIYCMLSSNGSGGGSSSTSNNNNNIDVFCEDSSGNGTIINGTTLLKRGERRLMHTGDEVCLVNPHPLRKKIRDPVLLQQIQRRYTYIFINAISVAAPVPVPSTNTNSSKRQYYPSMAPPSSTKRRAVVNVRALVNHSLDRHSPASPNRASAFTVPSTTGKDATCASIPSTDNTKAGADTRRVEQYYDIRDTLGTGTCGEVKRAICRKTGHAFAIKMIPLAKNRLSPKSNQKEELAALQAEASILQALHHPYIVQLADVFFHHDSTDATPTLYLVMELMSGGDLFDRIVDKGRYTEVESRRTMRRLLNAIYYLHEIKSLVHRDLKPENILCMSRTNDVNIKLTDFGLAKSVTQEGLKTFCGTPQYFAPEVLRRNYTIAGKGRYGKEADMWSLGVILYILLSGTPPFDISNLMDSMGHEIQFPPAIWKGISQAARDFVTQLLVTDPMKRISVIDACDHAWLQCVDGDSHTHPLDDPNAPMRKVEGGAEGDGSDDNVEPKKLDVVMEDAAPAV
jgi:serine/threonine protein kinase